MVPKYITVNGVMKKNPNYSVSNSNSNSTPSNTIAANNNQSLAVVSSPNDLELAQQTQEQSSHYTIPMAASTSETVEMLQDEEILAKYKSSVPLDGGLILDQLGEMFARSETPFGMINKLMMLTSYKLDFIVDDSGSMDSPTDVDALQASEPVRSVISRKLNRDPRPGEKMKRIQEVEDRLHNMIDILAFIPLEHIQIRFLNNPTVLKLDRSNKTPQQFQAYAHELVRNQFASLNLGSTPVKKALTTGFDYEGQWCHYLFNDGVPDEGAQAIASLIASRRNPQNHPLTLISCTNNDKDTEWMKSVDASATYVAEVDDFADEYDEVIRKQGVTFPYTRGLWLLCQLVAAINPYDLDALDENLPFTKFTLDNILGRQLNPAEYQYYFERNPNAFMYVNEYQRFLQEEVFANQIIPKATQTQRERNAGYVNGERPTRRPFDSVSTQIQPITNQAMQQFTQQYSVTNTNGLEQQMSAVSIAPHSAFMPPPNGNNNNNNQQYQQNQQGGYYN